MLNKLEIEQRLKALMPILSAKYFVNKIGYFGSFARNEQNENSDIDILVDFARPIGWEFFDLQELLEKELQIKVDLVSIKALKAQLKDGILKQVKYV